MSETSAGRSYIHNGLEIEFMPSLTIQHAKEEIQEYLKSSKYGLLYQNGKESGFKIYLLDDERPERFAGND